jgi:cation diffusion facilitator CzcD-associated flavoprotein CzcO
MHNDVVIIGAGFGGIALGIALKRAGIQSFTLLERASSLGGVWRDNHYPGAACDVPSAFYCYSFESDYPWSGRYGTQSEILDYIEQCAAKHGIMPHIRFNAEVASAGFDADAGEWRVRTTAGDELRARFLVSAIGLFNRPLIPELPGHASFLGAQFHSAQWNEEVALDGKRVAVIGTGASAIQFVPAIAPRVAHLTVFQRSPPYVFPRLPGGAPARGSLGATLRRKLDRLGIYVTFEKLNTRRRAEFETHATEGAFRTYLSAKIQDPAFRARLTPHYPFGCKRTLFSNDWYDTLLRPNVELVDRGIDAIVPEGVRSADGVVHQADVLIYGTGFSPAEFLLPMRIIGNGGREIHEAWGDGAEAYLGMAVAGFPNFFMMYGPNTNVPGSIVFMLECQAGYIAKAIRALARRGARYMELRKDTERRFNIKLRERINAIGVLVAPECRSYFMTASRKVTVQWPGFMSEYYWHTRRVRSADYEFAR